ncbi:uncharacterized protein F4812DRAFT_85958 [Daldinia caldariorum]|uniref:uncharacterized protein n=1 Tax=Daldinia caldariorum TaxID=326644 RepID=UPI002007AE7C|nr:uncharacterized protein F4812DRAFT_85958 [Daldinia caldariorum]KAI1466593.1 hypothetical protein F4812DRAFT_85958 [Daldinia caldariorum]
MNSEPVLHFPIAFFFTLPLFPRCISSCLLYHKIHTRKTYSYKKGCTCKEVKMYRPHHSRKIYISSVSHKNMIICH